MMKLQRLRLKLVQSILLLAAVQCERTGFLESDYAALGAALDRVVDIANKYGLVASYHPHLGTNVQAPEQLDKLMPLTKKINLCPDTAHIEAGGGDPVEVIKKIS
ncbi:hypothetical protein GCM10020331_009080 [Ectobacillus funiculus]